MVISRNLDDLCYEFVEHWIFLERKVTSEAGSFFHLLTKVWFPNTWGRFKRTSWQGGITPWCPPVMQHDDRWAWSPQEWRKRCRESSSGSPRLRAVAPFLLPVRPFRLNLTFARGLFLQLQFSLCHMLFCMLTHVTVKNSESRIMQQRIPSQTRVLTLALTDMTNLNVFRP